MKAFETAPTRHCGLAMFDFFVRVKAGINAIHFGAVRATVLYIMFHFLERSFLLKQTRYRDVVGIYTESQSFFFSLAHFPKSQMY